MQSAGPVTRGETAPGAPPGIVADIFAADENGTVIERDGDGVILAQLSATLPFDPADEQNAAIMAQLRDQFAGQAADDVLTLFTAAVRDQAGVRVNQELVETTLARFQ
jgi:hypothetical protein